MPIRALVRMALGNWCTLTFSNQVAYGAIGQHHLYSRDPALAVYLGHQRLAHYADEQGRQAGLGQGPLMGWEHIDDTLYGLVAAGGMAGSQQQMAGLGDGQSGGSCFEVAHFSHQDHIRVLPQNMPQGLGEGVSIAAQLSLRECCISGWYRRIQSGLRWSLPGGSPAGSDN